MSELILVGLFISAVVIALLFWATQKNQSSKQYKRAQEQRYAIHEQTMQELKQEFDVGNMDEASYQQAQFETQAQLVEDMRRIETHATGPKSTSKLMPLAIIAVQLVAAAGYYYLGNWAAADPAKTFSMNGNVEQFVGAVEQLERRAAQEPENLNHQVMLARSYRAMGRNADAVAAYGRSWELIKDNPTELSLFAGVLALYRGSFDGKPDELLGQALAIDPEHHDALLLLGGSQYQKRDYRGAIKTWERLEALLPEGSEERADISRQIADAKEVEADPTKAVDSELADEMNDMPHPPIRSIEDIPEHKMQ